MSADLRTDKRRKLYERARLEGSEARRNGAKEGANPYRGSDKLGRELNHEWGRGWTIQDGELRGAR